MSRILTTYKQPPISVRIAQAPNIEALGAARAALALGLHTGKLDPDRKTLQRWEDAIWQTVLRFMFEAKRPGDLCYVYNFVLRWDKPPAIAEMIERALELKAKVLPNDAEWLLSQGIEIEGVTKLPRP